ncbi:MAG: SIS domain-containing protein, partial [Myxococcota bacterium]
MCGIYGMVNGHPVARDLVRGLGRLEYRGYDSAGVALMTEGRIARRRVAGRVAGLDESLDAMPLPGSLGIAHTRWATHGGPSEDNAHPHVAGRVAVVHNGIVENHAALRRELEGRGRVFHSETDSEVIAHLLDEALGAGSSPREALQGTCERLDGSFALGVLIEGHERLLAARRGSPLVVGAMHGGAVLASDALALADDAEGLLALEDGEVAELGRGGIEVFDADGLRVDRELAPMEADEVAERGDFDSFMAKEMHEQPEALRRALAHLGCRGIRWDAVDEVVFASCGTSRYASEVGAAWLRELAGLPARVVIASEFRYAPGPWSAAGPGRTLAVFVSQSGETADTLAAL